MKKLTLAQHDANQDYRRALFAKRQAAVAVADNMLAGIDPNGYTMEDLLRRYRTADLLLQEKRELLEQALNA